MVAFESLPVWIPSVSFVLWFTVLVEQCTFPFIERNWNYKRLRFAHETNIRNGKRSYSYSKSSWRKSFGNIWTEMSDVGHRMGAARTRIYFSLSLIYCEICTFNWTANKSNYARTRQHELPPEEKREKQKKLLKRSNHSGFSSMIRGVFLLNSFLFTFCLPTLLWQSRTCFNNSCSCWPRCCGWYYLFYGFQIRNNAENRKWCCYLDFLLPPPLRPEHVRRRGLLYFSTTRLANYACFFQLYYFRDIPSWKS